MIAKGLKINQLHKFAFIALLAFLMPFSTAFAGESPKDGEVKPYDPAAFAMHHIQDANEWHLWGNKAIPLPIIAYSKEGGMLTGLSSMFHHGHTAKDGYVMNHGRLMKVQDPSFPTGEVEVHGVHEKVIEKVKKDKEGNPVKDEEGNVVTESVAKYFADVNGKDYEVSRAGFTDFSITKNVFSMLLVALIMGFIFIKVARAYKTREGKAPKGLQSFFEPLIVFVRDEIAKPNLGKHSEKYMPYLLTVFFFIWMLNMLGQVPIFPGAANVTGNIAVTAVLAVITFVLTQLAGTKHYWAHTFMPPVPKWLYPIMVPVEFAGLFIKPMALMIRLFANISAGHILVLSLVGLIFIFSNAGTSLAGGLGGAAVAVPFTLFIMYIELLVAFLQAFIFTILSAVFIGLAIDEGH